MENEAMTVGIRMGLLVDWFAVGVPFVEGATVPWGTIRLSVG